MNSAIIYITSPFQLLCAINAIRDFKITNYKLYLIDVDRIDQIVSIANYFNLKYEILKKLKINKIQTLLLYYNIFFKGRKKYDYLLIGDIREIQIILKAFDSSKIFKSIVYLDDGNVTIAFFNNTMPLKFGHRIHIKLIEFALSVRRISKYYYTIYDVYSSKYIIKKNPFKIIDNKTFINNISLFVGTNSDSFCKEFGYSKELYLNTLEKILKSITTNSKIIYIAHGRESFEEIKTICRNLNIIYVRPDKCIEMYLIENNLNVISAYGLSSSALYNIKKMYPNSNVINICFSSNNPDFMNGYITVSKLYNEVGIINCDLQDFI